MKRVNDSILDSDPKRIKFETSLNVQDFNLKLDDNNLTESTLDALNFAVIHNMQDILDKHLQLDSFSLYPQYNTNVWIILRQIKNNEKYIPLLRYIFNTGGPYYLEHTIITNMRIVEKILFNIKQLPNPMYWGVKSKNIDILKLLHSLNYSKFFVFTSGMTTERINDILKPHNNLSFWYTTVMDYAIFELFKDYKNNSKEAENIELIIEYLFSIGYTCSQLGMCLLCAQGNIKFIKLMFEHRVANGKILDFAVDSENYDAVEFVYNRCLPQRYDSLRAMATILTKIRNEKDELKLIELRKIENFLHQIGYHPDKRYYKCCNCNEHRNIESIDPNFRFWFKLCGHYFCEKCSEEQYDSDHFCNDCLKQEGKRFIKSVEDIKKKIYSNSNVMFGDLIYYESRENKT